MARKNNYKVSTRPGIAHKRNDFRCTRRYAKGVHVCIHLFIHYFSFRLSRNFANLCKTLVVNVNIRQFSMQQ